jgi:hypothetical protein
MTGINFKETGNNFTGNFTTNALTFSVDFVVNGSGSGGFAVTLLAPIVESSNGTGCPESGHIKITGANSTTAEGIYNSDDTTMTVIANGSVVNPSAACI